MTYKLMASLTGALFAVLAAAFLIAPDLVTSGWGLSLENESAFMGQRLAAAFAGFAVMGFLSRSLEPSPARRAIALGITTSMVIVAVVGLAGLARGIVGPGILLAVLVELALAVGLIATGRHVS